MRKILLLLAFSSTLFAADGWDHDAGFSLTGSQSQLSHWSGGGESAIAWEVDLNVRSEKVTDSSQWTWRYGAEFGQSQQGSRGSRKTGDRIHAETKYVYSAGMMLDPYIAASARTQIAAGHRYGPQRKISDFADPAYVQEAVGVGKSWQSGNAKAGSRAGASFRHVLTKDFNNYAGGSSTLTDFGLESVTDLGYKLSTDAQITNRTRLFKGRGDPWIVRTDTGIDFSLAEYLVLKVDLIAVRDQQAFDGWQVKQSTGIGFRYQL